jgi:16S rRNA (guanine527-N7)-methyltransferase
MVNDAVSGVSSLGKEWAFPVSGEVADRLAVFLVQLLRWNERVNLTGAKHLSELIGDHLPDSFALARLCPQGANVVDIGSGGGLPAVPFAILRPDCQITLVEPRAKRIAFLNMAVRECSLKSVRVIRARAEELPPSNYNLASSRATFTPEIWLRMAPQFLTKEGLAVVLSTGMDAAWEQHGRVVESVSYLTPAGSPRWCGCFCFT